jgi:hypothetical protein
MILHCCFATIAWYFKSLIILGGICEVLGFIIGVFYTDELTGPSPEVLTTLYIWLLCGLLGPITVACWLIYMAYKEIKTNKTRPTTPTEA